MGRATETTAVFQFGVYQFDSRRLQLTKHGVEVRLQQQAARLLNLLLIGAGQLISREEIRTCLWDEDTTVDFELGINRCVRQLRAALHDETGAPRYIERAPRLGYRFIAPVSSSHAVPVLQKPPVPETDSVAVLPFANLGGEAEDEYFSDGLTEEITNVLAQDSQLKVIARTSAFAFKGRNEDIRSIAATLHVSMMLEGSVRRAGNMLRVTAQLIRGHDGSHIFSKRYDREMTDIFALQDEIAADVAAQLRARLPGKHAASVPARKHPTENLGAYEALLEGRFHACKFTPQGFTKAKECYERALALDPTCSAAYAGLADYFLGLALASVARPLDVVGKAKEAAQRALAFDDNNSEAHSVIATSIAIVDYDWAEVERHFRLARNSENSSLARIRYAMWCLAAQERIDEALYEVEGVIEVDPLLLLGRTCCAVLLCLRRDFEAAAACCERALEIDPHFPNALHCLTYIKVCQGRSDEALRFARQLFDLLGPSSTSLESLAIAEVIRGKSETADRALQEFKALPCAENLCAMGIGEVYAFLGEKDEMFRWLRLAISNHEPRVVWLKSSVWLDPFRSDPQYRELLASMNLAAPSANPAGR